MIVLAANLRVCGFLVQKARYVEKDIKNVEKDIKNVEKYLKNVHKYVENMRRKAVIELLYEASDEKTDDFAKIY